MFCGAALATCKVDVAAFTKICERVRLLASRAKSVSRMALSAALTFSRATFSELIVEPTTFFWKELRWVALSVPAYGAAFTLLGALAKRPVNAAITFIFGAYFATFSRIFAAAPTKQNCRFSSR